MTLTDRKNEFVKNNKTVCQENCDFSDYDYDIQKAKCSCSVKSSSNSTAHMNINMADILNSFKDLKNIFNIVLLRCYNVLFTKDGIIKNFGFYIIISILLLHFIFIIIFYRKYLKIIKEKINKIVYALKNLYLVKRKERAKRKKELKKAKQSKAKKYKERDKLQITKDKKRSRRSKKKEVQKKQKKENRKENIKNLYPRNYKHSRKRPNFIFNDIDSNPPRKNKRNNLIIENNLNFLNLNNNKNNKVKKSKSSKTITIQKKEKETIMKAKEIMIHNDQELNDMPYELALRFDNRTYCEYYCSLIKTKNIVIFSFFYNGDYNSKIVKVDLFFVSFVIYFTVNALFFTDETMHKIYEDKGKFQILYQLPQIIFSSLISIIFDILLTLLALPESNILKLKSEKEKEGEINKNEINQKEKDLNKKLQIKFALYFIISTIFLLSFWYYLSMFCAIYKNTQLHLIKDTFISFGLSCLYPFGIQLLPGFFRIPCLSNKRGKRKFIYLISKLLQVF